MLIHLMEGYIRSEGKRMEEDNTLNLMIKDIEIRNKNSMKEEMVGLHREVKEEFEPPMIPMTNDNEKDWSKQLSEDPSDDLSGIDRLWKL